ncbi:MAG: hypothetical protein LUG91_05310 [Ruminococcus sp.]|nr:hypothetical protein [Ruminococcus sp.]
MEIRMKILDKMKESCSADVMLLVLVSFFIGLIAGFIISPVKNGIAIGSYNGCGNRITDSNKIDRRP